MIIFPHFENKVFNFSFDFDPTKRDSFWIIVVGLGTAQLYHKLTDQAAVQKFLAVKSYRNCIK